MFLEHPFFDYDKKKLTGSEVVSEFIERMKFTKFPDSGPLRGTAGRDGFLIYEDDPLTPPEGEAPQGEKPLDSFIFLLFL